jgi:sugar diacid utilization regulator
MIRHEEAVRTEFIDDLLRGDADVAGMVERAQPFGLDLTRAHHVALAETTGTAAVLEQAALRIERAVVDEYGDRDVLVATKDQRVVVLVPGEAEDSSRATESTLTLSRFLDGRLHEWTGDQWRVGAGRAFRGAFGVARSYEEARETLDLAQRLGLTAASLNPGQVLAYRVLVRDQTAMIDLVHTVLGPLVRARGGPQPLLDTLQAYFDCGATATHTARQMHLSVRAVTYRLDRVKQLTGYDPAHPEQRFVLQSAVLGARLLGWPGRSLPQST